MVVRTSTAPPVQYQLFRDLICRRVERTMGRVWEDLLEDKKKEEGGGGRGGGRGRRQR